jgi:glyoxylase-like metal-dependent hydrolase (beta-lactamase superfamily II)
MSEPSPEKDRMKVLANTGGLAETNAYLIVDEATRAAAIIDAPESTTADLIAAAKKNNYDVQYLLLTHGHWDHISDHQVVTDAFPKAKVLIHKLEEKKLQNPVSTLFDLPYTIPPRNADAYIEDGQKLHIGHITLAAMHTPGHAEGHLCFYSNEHEVLFAGDLLMDGSVGRYDLPDGNVELLKKSLARVMLLPDNTEVLSGHGPGTLIGRQRAGNPFIRQWRLG